MMLTTDTGRFARDFENLFENQNPALDCEGDINAFFMQAEHVARLFNETSPTEMNQFKARTLDALDLVAKAIRNEQ